MLKKSNMQTTECSFTPRQIEVVKAVLDKGCQKEACRSLSISKQTLKNELKDIKDKTGVDTVVQLVHIMTKRGII